MSKSQVVPLLLSVFAGALVGVLGAYSWRSGDEAPPPGVTPPAPRATAEPGMAPAPDLGSAQREAVVSANPDAGAGYEITGRVIDAFDQPVAAATVQLGDASTAATRTGPDGRFLSVGNLDAGPELSALVLAPGYPPLTFQVGVPAEPGIVDVGDLQLRQGGSLFGLIVDADGKPFQGATAILVPANGNALGSFPQALPAAMTTDARGAYRSNNLMPGSYRVRAVATGAAFATSPVTQVKEGEEVRLEPLRLVAGVALQGRVLDAGEAPIARATVIAGAERATSDADGRFRIEHLRAGPCNVEVRAVGRLSWQGNGIDPTQELVVHLAAGLRIAGTVYDAATGQPVETFAVLARRRQPLPNATQGNPAEQLQHRLSALRSQQAATTDAAARQRDEVLAAELTARLGAVQSAVAPPSRAPLDLGAATEHENGQFQIDGLEEGLYVVDVLSPGHQFVRSSSFELRRETALPELHLIAIPAATLTGTVRCNGVPVQGALVERLAPAARSVAANPVANANSRFAWLLGEATAAGDITGSVRTDRDGRFELRHQTPGQACLVVNHADFCTTRSTWFLLRGTLDVPVVVQGRAQLSGHVRGIPANRSASVRVLVLGGTNLTAAAVAADGSYHFGSLEPGNYVVRAAVGDTLAKQADLLHALFGGNTPPPPRDLVLGPAEHRTHDLILALPPQGVLQGTVLMNGMPAANCRVELVIPDWARPMLAAPDARGAFTLVDVPAGEHVLRVTVGNGRQTLHRELVAVVAGLPATLQIVLRGGGLAGRVLTDEGGQAALEGALWVLPGATEPPADLPEYQKTHGWHRLSVRGGTFRAELLTAGPALLLLQLRGRQPATSLVDIPAAIVHEVELRAGALLR